MKNEIIEFAEKAGLLRAVFACDEVLVWEAETKHLERFAALVAEKATEQANAVLMSLCQEAADALAAPVQEPVAYLFTNVQSGDIEASTNPDHKEGEREMWYREPLVRPPAQPAPVQQKPLFANHA